MSQSNLRDNVPRHILDTVEYVRSNFVTNDERIAFLREAGVPLGQIEGVLDILRGDHAFSGSGNNLVGTRFAPSVPPQKQSRQPCGSAFDMPFAMAQSSSSLVHRPTHLAGPASPTMTGQMASASQSPAELLSAPYTGSVHTVGQQQWASSAPLGTIDPRLLGGLGPPSAFDTNALGIAGTRQSMNLPWGPMQLGMPLSSMTLPGSAPLSAAQVQPQTVRQPKASLQPPTPVRPAVATSLGPAIVQQPLPPGPIPSEATAQTNQLALPPRPPPFEAKAQTNQLALPRRSTPSEVSAQTNRLALPPRLAPSEAKAQTNQLALPSRPTVLEAPAQTNRLALALPPLPGQTVPRPLTAPLSAPPSISLALPPVSTSPFPAILAQSPAGTSPSTPDFRCSTGKAVDAGASKAVAESVVNRPANKGSAGNKAPKEPLPLNLQAIVDASELAKRKKIEEALRGCSKGLVFLNGPDACTQCQANGFPCHAKTTRATKEQMPDGKLRFLNCNMCVVLKVGQYTCSLHKDYEERQRIKAAPPVFGGRSISLPPTTESASAGSKRKTRDWMKPSQQQMAVMNASNFGAKRTKLSDGGRSRSVTPGQSDPSVPWSRSRSQTPASLSAPSQSGCSSETSTPLLTATGSRASPLTVVEEDDEDEDLEEVLILPLGASITAKYEDHSAVDTHAACPQNLAPQATGPAEDDDDDDNDEDMEEVPIPAGTASQSIELGKNENDTHQNVLAQTPQRNRDDTPEEDVFAQVLQEALQVDNDQPQAQNEPQTQPSANPESSGGTQPSADVSTSAATPRGQKRGGVEAEGGNVDESSNPPPKKRRKKAKKTLARPPRAPTPRELAKRVVEAGPLLDDLDQQIDYAYEVYRRVPFIVRQIKSRKDIYYAPHIKCVRCAENGKLCAYAVISLAQVDLDCDWVVLPGCEACEGAGLPCHFQYDAGVMFGTSGSIRAKVDPSEGQPRGPRPGGTAGGMFNIVPYFDPKH